MGSNMTRRFPPKLQRMAVTSVEQVNSLTRESTENCNIDAEPITMYPLVRAKLEQLYPEIADLTEDFVLAVRNNTGIDEAVKAIRNSAPIVKLSVWTRLTKNGADDLPFAKQVHKHLADIVISLF